MLMLARASTIWMYRDGSCRIPLLSLVYGGNALTDDDDGPVLGIRIAK